MKPALLILYLLIGTTTSSAQKLYVRTNLSYALPAFSPPLKINGYPYTSYPTPDPARQVLHRKNASHGAGWTGELHAGYFFNNSIGINLGWHRQIQRVVYKEQATFGIQGQQLDIRQYAMNAQFLSISIALKDPEYLKYIFIHGGAILPVRSSVITESQTSPGTPGPESFSSGIMSMYFGIGLHGAIGIDYPLTKNLCVSAGISAISLSLWTKEKKMESYTINSEDRLNLIDSKYQIINYQKNYAQAPGSGGSDIFPSYQVPFSNLGFRIGLLIKTF